MMLHHSDLGVALDRAARLDEMGERERAAYAAGYLDCLRDCCAAQRLLVIEVPAATPGPEGRDPQDPSIYRFTPPEDERER